MTVSKDVPSIKNVLSDDKKEEWSATIDAKLNQIKKFGIWEIVEISTNTNIIPC